MADSIADPTMTGLNATPMATAAPMGALSSAAPAVGGTPNYVTPPNLGAASGSSAVGSFTQGAPLPNITTTQSQATAAPSWYMDYLNNLAGNSTAAGNNAQFVGAQPLQQEAFGKVAENVGNYQPNLQAANQLTMNAATTGAPQLAQTYMNPYTNSVVNAIGALGQQNVMNNIAPQTTAGIVGAGQFGSQRGANALASNLNQAALGITAQQAQALKEGYQQSITNAQNDLQRQMAGGQQMGALGGQTQQYGLADVNALSTMGGQQQQIGQNEQLFPLQLAAQQAAIMKGFTVPTSVTNTYTGPIPGAYQTSPLAQLASLGSGITGLFATGAAGGPSVIDNATKWFKSLGSETTPTSPVGNINPATNNTWADDLAAGNTVM